jgi:hypothetical protein
MTQDATTTTTPAAVVHATSTVESTTLYDAVSGRDSGLIVDEAEAYAESLPAIVSTKGQESTTAWPSSPIYAPSNYKYCGGNWDAPGCKPKARHDYCTWSPDRYGRADFRGPCAWHDFSIDYISKKSISVEAKRTERNRIDDRFGVHLHQNCNYYNKPSNFAAWDCRVVANVYVGVVRQYTKNWDGK